MPYSTTHASLAVFAALILLNLLVLWACLSHGRILRPVPTVLMAAAMVWLSGCAPSSTGADNAAAQTGGAEADSAAAQTDEAVTDGAAARTDGTTLEVLCFSAGKADAFLLTTPQSAVLIDCGEKGFGKTILPELEARGLARLDYLIITHFDQDHVGGAAKVLNNFPVDTVLQSNCPKDSDEYEKYRKALQNASLEAVTVRDALDFTLDGVSYHVDPPRRNGYQNDDSNNSSLIVTVQVGDSGLLFLGDAQTERLEEFLSWNTDTWDVLKVPHHGKEEPLLAEVLAAVQPRYAVITSSEEEPEDKATVSALDAAGVETFLTRQGEVVITCTSAGVEAGYR